MDAGQLLGDRYRLEGLLGRGGMSLVWQAYDEVLCRSVAVKILAGETALDPALRASVRTEARVAAGLSHPNVTNVFDYGEAVNSFGETTPYLVMELLRGETLERRLDAGSMPPVAALRVLADVASALAAAHEVGLVHRDVKPGNVMLVGDLTKVFDFGIAVPIGHVESAGEGAPIFGTAAYLAPERLTAGPAVPATDVYALGVLLYRLLANGLPWSVSTPTALLTAHRYTEPRRLPAITGVPRQIHELYRNCLAKDPGSRPEACECAEVLVAAATADIGRDQASGARPAPGVLSTSDLTSAAVPAPGLSPAAGGSQAPVEVAAPAVAAAARRFQQSWRYFVPRVAGAAAVLLVAVVVATMTTIHVRDAQRGGEARRDNGAVGTSPVASTAPTAGTPGRAPVPGSPAGFVVSASAGGAGAGHRDEAAGAPGVTADTAGGGGGVAAAVGGTPATAGVPTSGASGGGNGTGGTGATEALTASPRSGPGAGEVTIPSAAGTVVAGCRSSQAYVSSWPPADGYHLSSIDSGASGSAVVVFHDDAGIRVRVTVSCRTGSLTWVIDRF